jgi:DNA repair protein SbcC/Rad50
MLATGGRLVAVISHLRAVAEQIPDVLAVTRTAQGSTARWLTNAERAQVAEADVVDADETLAALSGLLE